MTSRDSIFRFVALALLLFSGVELVACEALSPGTCEAFGSSTSQHPDCTRACLCCCLHIVVTQPVVVDPCVEAVPLAAPRPLAYSSIESSAIYHPPKT